MISVIMHESYFENRVFRICVLTNFEKMIVALMHESYFEKIVFRNLVLPISKTNTLVRMYEA